MIKIKIVKTLTLFEFIKGIYKGKYDNKDVFKMNDFEGNIDEFFNHRGCCNWLALNTKIEVGSDKE